MTQEQRHGYIEEVSKRYNLSKDDLYRYAIIEKYNHELIVAVYKNMQCDLKIYDV